MADPMDVDDTQDLEVLEEQEEEEEEEEEEDAATSAKDKNKQARQQKRADRSKKLSSRKESLVALNAEREKDRAKRIKFLVNQTDIFKHFLETSTATGNAKKTLRELLASAKPEDASPSKSEDKASNSSRRHRKTEKDEDAELLAATEQSDDLDIIRFSETPKYINGEMRDYQVAGLNWLISLHENGINGILADEMGLGKSLQTISLLGYLKHFAGVTKGPHLLVTPKTTLHNWLNEFKKWCPSLNAFILHGSKEARGELIETTLFGRDWDVCITSYEMVLLEKAALKKIAWHYVIIDEAHRIKNENSLLSQIMRIFDCKSRLLITGTPLQNSLHELWALLNFLLPDVFGSSEDFDSWFTFNDENDKEAAVKQLHKVLKPFLLRRLKLDVEKSLKPKKETKLYLGMSQLQRDIYQKLLMKDIDAINGALGKGEGKTRLLNIVMQLRKCCNHPYLFDGVEPGPPYTTDEHIIRASGKMMVLDKLLTKLKENGSRVLLFSQMSRVLDILEDYCIFRGHEYCRIDGQTEHEIRQSQIEDFNREKSDKFIFLLTTRAGGLGINLATADIVILYDSDWNPQVDLQAQDRAHRIGQKKQVHVFRFVTEQSVEEKMIERAEMKLRLDQVVIQQGALQQQQKAASKEELLNMVQFGAQDILHSKDSGFNADDIEELLKKGEAKTEQLNEKLKAAGLDVLQSFSLDGGASSSVYHWEGEDYRDKQVSGAGINWIEPAKRDRTRNYNIDEYYRDALSQQRVAKSTREPRPPRQAQVSEFQFFPRRLLELQDREIYAYRKSIGYRVPRGTDPDAERKQKEEQDKIDNAEPLTEAEIAEKDSLMEQGFSDWGRRDFYAFVKACEKHGRHNLKAIAAEIEGKTFEEVQQYSKVFWERYRDLPDHEKVVAAIEKGESKIKRREDIQRHLEAKVRKFSKPLQQLRIVYNQNKGKNYTEEEDRFLVCTLERIGYAEDDVYDRIRKEIRESPLFRFDWFIKSRTSIELQRRCATLINLIEKELGEGGDDDEEEQVVKRSRVAPSKKKEEPKEVKADEPKILSSTRKVVSRTSTPQPASSSSSTSAKKRTADNDDDDSVDSPASVKKQKQGSDSDASPTPSTAPKKRGGRK